jgi:hypothetical protein
VYHQPSITGKEARRMRYFSQGRFRKQVSFLRKQFLQMRGMPLSNVLSAEMVERELASIGGVWLDRIYTPVVTLWVFLSQVLSADHSCRAAVARLISHRVASGESPCSAETGAYCQARKRLPEKLFAQTVRQTGRALEDQIDRRSLWKGRHVKVFDGSTVSMPDTAANQQAYPQPASQKPGVGFPLARIAAVFSLASAAILELGICRFAGKGQSELGLLRLFWNVFHPGDVMLADRYLCSWFEIAILKGRNVDSVCRLHQQRRADFRRGKRLSRNDHLVYWPKPRKPDWLDQETYDSLPNLLVIRETRVWVTQPGFRTEEVIVATTLLDAEAYPKSDLADLYRARWNAELDLRSLKQTMQMDVLRCRTPELVRKEIWTHLLAYNLIRTIMAQAAEKHGLRPRSISFKGTIQTLAAFQPLIELTAGHDRCLAIYHQILDAIATHRVADRPNRYEPRRRKRRPKPYPLLMKPRYEAKRDMLKRVSEN